MAGKTQYWDGERGCVAVNAVHGVPAANHRDISRKGQRGSSKVVEAGTGYQKIRLGQACRQQMRRGGSGQEASKQDQRTCPGVAYERKVAELL